MNRRKLLSGCAASLIIAGCLDGSSNGDADGGRSTSDDEPSEDTNGSSDGEGDDEEYESFYELQIDAPEESTGEMDSCKFENLPEGAQTEFENAIEEANFETEDSVMYRLEDSPVMLDTDCYGQYIEFEGEYYEVNVIAVGG